jgi:hypothetical protein
MQMLRQDFRDVVLYRPEESTVQILLMAGGLQVLGDEALE